MQHNITTLTFLPDPMTYQGKTDELCALIPPGIHSELELADVLIKELDVSKYCKGDFGMDWNVLFDEFRFWDDWKVVPQRAVIIHQDIPLLQGAGWYSLKIYLETLIESIIFQQEREPTEANPAPKRELVVIFPSQAYEELLAVLNHPPVWEVSIGFVERQFGISIEPSWSQILHHLQLLNGVTAEECWLYRENLDTMQVQYLKNKPGYYLHYSSPGRETELVASSDPASSFPPVLPFSLASQVLETFFQSGERSSLVQWLPVPDDTHSSQATFALSYFRSAEEEYIERNKNTLYETIFEGIADVLDKGDQVFSIPYWKELLTQPDLPLSQRITALCVVGMSDLPDALDLLHPFLASSITQERWVSARFLGTVQDEHTLPVLLSMLTEEFPLKEGIPSNTSWYEFWRPYAPRLLHHWQTPAVTARLQEALGVWVQADPFFDHEYDLWLHFEKELCYELGYRGNLSALEGLTLEEEHRQELLKEMERGARDRRMHLRRT